MSDVQMVSVLLITGIIIMVIGNCCSNDCSPCTWTTWGKCQPNNAIERQVCCTDEIANELKSMGKVTVLGCVKECNKRNMGNVSVTDEMTQSCHYGDKTTTVKTTPLPTTTTLKTTMPTSASKTTQPLTTTVKTTLLSSIWQSTTVKTTQLPTTTTVKTTVPTSASKTTQPPKTTVKTTLLSSITSAKPTTPKLTSTTVVSSLKSTTSKTTKGKTQAPGKTSTTGSSGTTTAGIVTAKGRIQGPSGKQETGSSPLPGAIGGVVGVLLLAAIAAGLFYFLWKRKKRGMDEKVHPSTENLKEAETKDPPPMENGAPPSDHRV